LRQSVLARFTYRRRIRGRQRGHSTQVATRRVGQINTDKYPRIVYAVAVNLKKTIDLSSLASSQAAESVRTACLDKDDLSISMELAGELITAGIEGLLFPSVVGADDNLVVYRVNCDRTATSVKNERQVVEQLRRIAGRHK
jgi:hypothetical protein